MDDEGIAPNTVHTADSVGMGRKSRQYTIFQYCVQAQLSPIPTGSAVCTVFGAIPSSAIVQDHLYTTPSSTVFSHPIHNNLQYVREYKSTII